MRKVLIERPGDYSVLKVVDAPGLVPGPGQVLVETEAVGVNFADSIVRMGLYPSAKEFVGWPITPGFEFAGRVKALGAGAQGFEVRQAVMGVALFGAYASEICAPVQQIFPIPEGWSMSQAATFHVPFLSAWYALRELVPVRPGARVLVHSAAGGVGSALTQLAHALGCFVVGVVGAPHKVAAAKLAGADEVIDKSSVALWPSARVFAPKGFDVVLDANGVDSIRQSYENLRPSGRLVIYGAHSMLTRGRGKPNWIKLLIDFLRTPRFNPLELTNANKSVLAFNLSYLFDRIDLLTVAHEELFNLVQKGQIRPSSVTDYAFEHVAEAQRAIERGDTTGRLCLRLGR